MSFSFYISNSEGVDFATVDAGLRASFGDALMWEGEAPSPWPVDHYAHAYLWGVSTRSVELGQLDDSFQVRIMSCSCSEDYEVALRAVELIAGPDGSIEPEMGGEYTTATLRDDYDQDWIDHQVEAGATILPRMLESGTVAGPLTIPGPNRDFIFGDRVMAELGSADDSYAERLFAKIRAVRYFADDAYFEATPMQLTPDDGESVTIAVLGPGVAYLLPNVKYLALSTEPLLFMPYAAIWDLAPELCRALDDGNLLVDAINDDQWEDFVRGASKLAVEI